MDSSVLSYVFYVDFILMSYIAQILILENIILDPMLPNLYSEHFDTCLYVWLSTSYAMIMMPLIIYILKKNIFKHEILKNKIYENNTTVSLSYNSFLYYVLSIISIASIIYTIFKFNYIGLLDIFLGKYSHFARTNYTYNTSVNRYIVDVFAQLLSQIMVYIWYIKWNLFKKKMDFIMFAIMFLFSILILSMSMAKAPIAIFIFSFLFLKIKIKGRLKIKNIIFVGFFLLILMISIYVLIYNINVFFAINRIITRVTIFQNTGNYLNFIYFPDMIPHLGITSLSQGISSLFGIPYSLRSARLVSEYAFGVRSDGVIGSIVSLFIGDAWASFGIFGVIFSPIIVGLVIGTIYYTTFYSKKIEMWALYAFFSINNFVVMDFSSFLYPWSSFVRPILVTLVVIFLGVRVRKQIIKVNKSR